MHLYDLPEPLRSALLGTAIADIRIVCQITAFTRAVAAYAGDGTPLFGPGTPRVTWMDLTRLSSAPVSISLQKPVLPADGTADNTITASEVSLQYINTDEYFAVTQLPSILESTRIEQARMVLAAQVGDDPLTRFPLYKGRVIGLPQEEFGFTTFTIRDELWAIIRTPVLFEKFAYTQHTQVLGGALSHGTFTIGSVGDTATYYDGVVAFAEEGQPLTSVSNSKPDDVEILRIVVGNEALPGKYLLEFVDQINYRVVYPDNEVLTGAANTLYPGTPGLNSTIIIPGSAWAITGDPTGAKIEFYVSYVVRGNPVTVIMNLLEKGFLGNWGSVPTFPATAPVDWQAFRDVQAYYAGFEVFIDSTNKDNKVWAKRRGQRPLSVLQLCQQIADHIGCQILVDAYGFVSISAPGIFPEVVHDMRDHGNQPAIISHVVEAQTRFNFVKLNYGFNTINDSFSTHLIYDERTDPADERVEYTMNFPFYKQDRSLYEMQRVGDIFMGRFLRSFVRVTLKVKPNWGLAILPGDRFRLVTATQPRLDMYVEVYSVDKNVGGEVIVRVVKTEAPLTTTDVFCEAEFCRATFC